MYKLNKTSSRNEDFKKLVIALDKDLAIRDGADHDFYSQFNKIDLIKHAIVIYLDDKAVGCGAIKEYDTQSMEIKRMFIEVKHRGKGIASIILKGLEQWAEELGYAKCILETGLKQPEAIRLYKKNDYQIIDNYGQYKGIENSICFEKKLNEPNQ